MAEPEELVAAAAYHAAQVARKLWMRRSPPPRTFGLVDVRRRLELFVTGVVGECVPISPARLPSRPSLLARVFDRRARASGEARIVASTDGSRIRLPPEIERSVGPAEDLETFRLLALEQMLRVLRGSVASAPRDDALLGDLFWLGESACVDRELVRELPPVRDRLIEARRQALSARPGRRLSPREAAVEELLDSVLRAPPERLPWGDGTATEVVTAWARERASAFRPLGGPYARLAPVSLWGAFDETEGKASTMPCGRGAPPDRREGLLRTSRLRRRPRVREALDDEDDRRIGVFVVKTNDAQESVEDPFGLRRPMDRERMVDAEGIADALSELPEARLVRSRDPVFECLQSDDPLPRAGAWSETAAARQGIAYPEWDFRLGAHRMPGALVQVGVPDLGSELWATDALRRHAGLLRDVRRCFERLRPERVRLRRQLDGDDLDVAAFVADYADRRAGCSGNDRLYEALRPRRRELAVCLLVDASASTDSWVSRDHRVVDVEKEALLVVGEVFGLLGDRYAILAFSGEGPERVSVRSLKGFGERYDARVRQRIAGLEPDGYTRLGAAVRHATALLSGERARRRLLIVLSDGKPNDVDVYEGRYGVEDTRQALAEARLEGISSFCFTVDREAPTYARRLFGLNAFTVLYDPQTLPRAVASLIRRHVAV